MSSPQIDTIPAFGEPEREVLKPALNLVAPVEIPAQLIACEVVPLFVVPGAERLVAPETPAQAEAARKPRWSSYSGKRAACDECLVFLHENGGKGPFPRSVRRVRTVRATGEQLRLCKEHAEPREIADGKTKKKAAARRSTRKG